MASQSASVALRSSTPHFVSATCAPGRHLLPRMIGKKTPVPFPSPRPQRQAPSGSRRLPSAGTITEATVGAQLQRLYPTFSTQHVTKGRSQRACACACTHKHTPPAAPLLRLAFSVCACSQKSHPFVQQDGPCHSALASPQSVSPWGLRIQLLPGQPRPHDGSASPTLARYPAHCPLAPDHCLAVPLVPKSFPLVPPPCRPCATPWCSCAPPLPLALLGGTAALSLVKLYPKQCQYVGEKPRWRLNEEEGSTSARQRGWGDEAVGQIQQYPP